MRKVIPILLLLFFGRYGHATGDSLHYLLGTDTVFLSVDFYGEKVQEYRLARKQTLFSLAKFYGLKVEDLYFYNPALQAGTTVVGQPVRVPIPSASILRLSPDKLDTARQVPVVYPVQKGETLYRIAKVYFQISMDTLMEWNQLEDFLLQPGQLLYVGAFSREGVADSLRGRMENPLLRSSYELGLSFQLPGQEIREQRGAAYWQKGAGEDAGALFALHRDAPPGSVVEVFNPMSHRRIFVKVLGTIPDAAYRDNVILVLSTRAARLLGGRDEQFFVRLRYHPS